MKFVKKHILGRVLGPAAAVYGLIAMLTGRAFLPGLQGNGHTLGGRGGFAMALAYLCGGIYLFIRLAPDKRMKKKEVQMALYTAQSALLLVFIAALAYVLLRVDAVG